MTEVRISETAWAELERLIETRRLPSDAAARALEIAEPLGSFPQMGRLFRRGRHELRTLVGPWNWMIIVYAYEESADRVTVVAIEDSRQSDSILTSA